MNPLTSLTSAHQAHLRRKVNAIIGSLQILACTNTVWVFCLTALPLRDRPGFLEQLTRCAFCTDRRGQKILNA